MTTFFEHLSNPEYMHVLLNPLPVYGLALGVSALLVAVISRHRVAILIALVPVFLASIAAWPTYHYGQEAYDRVKAMSDPVGEQWLDVHMERAEKLIYAFYVLAALAAAAAIAPLKLPRSATPLAATTLGVGLATLGVGGWIAYPGGHVRHKEFRFEPPPSDTHAEHTHSHGDGHAHGEAHGRESASPPEEQLEASHKQLEAADAAEGKSTSPQPTPIPHGEDGHEDQPKS